MSEQSPQWLTVDEVADRLHMHPEVVRRWLRAGRLAGRKWGRSWHIAADSLPEIATPLNQLENVFDATFEQSSTRTGLTSLRAGERQLHAVTHAASKGTRVRVRLAADAILVSPVGIAGISARNQWPATVESIFESLDGLVVHFGPSPTLAVSLTAPALRELKLRPGREVVLIFKATACHVTPISVDATHKQDKPQ